MTDPTDKLAYLREIYAKAQKGPKEPCVACGEEARLASGTGPRKKAGLCARCFKQRETSYLGRNNRVIWPDASKRIGKGTPFDSR